MPEVGMGADGFARMSAGFGKRGSGSGRPRSSAVDVENAARRIAARSGVDSLLLVALGGAWWRLVALGQSRRATSVEAFI